MPGCNPFPNSHAPAMSRYDMIFFIVNIHQGCDTDNVTVLIKNHTRQCSAFTLFLDNTFNELFSIFYGTFWESYGFFTWGADESL